MARHQQEIGIDELLDEASVQPEPRSGWRVLRATLSALLITAAVLAAPVSIATFWAKHQVFDSEGFAAVAAPAVTEGDGRQQAIDLTSKTILDHTTTPTAQALAALAAALGVSTVTDQLQEAVTQRISDTVQDAVQRSFDDGTAATAWRTAIESSHRSTLAPVLDGTVADSSRVIVQFGPIADAVRAELVGQPVADLLPASEASAEVGPSGLVARAQPAEAFAQQWGDALWIIVAAAALAGVLLAPRSRVHALARGAFGLTVTALLLAAAAWLGQQAAAAVMPAELSDLGTTVADAVLAPLRDAGLITAGIALITAIVARILAAIASRQA